MAIEINNATRKELLAIEPFNEEALFNSVILVPTGKVHDSGYGCMRFILLDDGDIVGCIDKGSDVVYPNGIGNYGLELNRAQIAARLVPHISLRVDCLKRSKCTRLIMSGSYKCDGFPCSDFIFYKVSDKSPSVCGLKEK